MMRTVFFRLTIYFVDVSLQVHGRFSVQCSPGIWFEEGCSGLVRVKEQSLPATGTDVWLCTFCHVADPHHKNAVVPSKDKQCPFAASKEAGFL